MMEMVIVLAVVCLWGRYVRAAGCNDGVDHGQFMVDRNARAAATATSNRPSGHTWCVTRRRRGLAVSLPACVDRRNTNCAVKSDSFYPTVADAAVACSDATVRDPSCTPTVVGPAGRVHAALWRPLRG